MKGTPGLRAVIFQHEADQGEGQLGPALRGAGFELVHRFRGAHHDDVDAALVVVLGGPMGVYEADLHPFLHAERAVLAERLALDRPCLGLCLGAQLLASAAGADVFPGKNGLEAGPVPLRLTRDAAQDPVFAEVPPRLLVAQLHRDTFSPVPGATLLASTDRYSQQAFRLGRSYGLQFHAELTCADFGGWLDGAEAELAAAGRALAPLKAQLGKLQAAEPATAALLRRLALALAAPPRA
jgi:GMP synthase (glutamine-hydrolysing)